MKTLITLLALFTALAAAAQVWTNLPPERQAVLIKAHSRYTFAVTNLSSFRFSTNAVPSAWTTNASTGDVTVKATTNLVTEVNPPLASRQQFYLRFWNEADASAKVQTWREEIFWQRLREKNAETAEAIATDREAQAQAREVLGH